VLLRLLKFAARLKVCAIMLKRNLVAAVAALISSLISMATRAFWFSF